MGASEEEKDRVSMENFGCKFSELKDPQDRMSVGGTIGGNMRKAALQNKPDTGVEGEQEQGEGAEEQGGEGEEAEGIDEAVGVDEAEGDDAMGVREQ